MIRLKKIRDSARGEDCTVNSPFCNRTPETTVLAHFGEPGEKGMGLKPDDTSAAYACSACHDWLDGRVNPLGLHSSSYEKTKEWYWFRAMRRTWKLLIENGVLK